MSVRFQYAGDKDISVGRSGGASIFSLPGPISFPEAGTVLETLYAQEYPLTEGGSSLTISSSSYPNQVADVNKVADGFGGFFIDWPNAFNIAFKPAGGAITTESGSLITDINGTMYSVGTYYTTYYHDGSGSYYTSGENSYLSSGTYITGSTGITSYININGTDYPNGTYDVNYYSDGIGGYYSENQNFSYSSYGTPIVSFNNQTEVPSGSGSYFDNGTTSEYFHDGSGGSYNTSGGSYIGYGNYITSDGTYTYFWDGNGSFYYY
jgi:hypothetical protein